jgi:predicted nucleotidyltransferase
MIIDNMIEDMKAKIVPVLKKYEVKKASFFGSIIRGKLKKDSDIDILVELSDELSLFDFIGIKNELEDIVKRKVDLVEYEMIKKPLKKRILAEHVRIL